MAELSGWFFGNITREHLAGVVRRVFAASPGPWRWEPPSGEDWPCGDTPLVDKHGEQIVYSWGYDAYGVDCDPHNAEFIAHSREDIAALLKLARSLALQLTRMRQESNARQDALVAEANALISAIDVDLRLVAVPIVERNSTPNDTPPPSGDPLAVTDSRGK